MTGDVQYTHIKCQQYTLTLLSIKSFISAIHYAIDIQEYKSTRYSGNESGPVHPRLLVGCISPWKSLWRHPLSADDCKYMKDKGDGMTKKGIRHMDEDEIMDKDDGWMDKGVIWMKWMTS